MHTKLLQLCPALYEPLNCSSPGTSVDGILQARILELVAMPSSRGSHRPRDQTHISYAACIGRHVLYDQFPLGSPKWRISTYKYKYLYKYPYLININVHIQGESNLILPSFLSASRPSSTLSRIRGLQWRWAWLDLLGLKLLSSCLVIWSRGYKRDPCKGYGWDSLQIFVYLFAVSAWPSLGFLQLVTGLSSPTCTGSSKCLEISIV